MGDNYNKLLNVAAAAIIDKGKILLIKREKPPFQGLWGMPGGKMDFGEHPEEAVLREIKEETNLDCKSQGFQGFASEIIHNSGEKVVHNLLYIYRLKPIHTNIKQSVEGELRWINLEEIDNLEMVPSDLAMIEEFVLKENKASLHKIKMIEDEGNYTMEEFKE